MLHVNYSAIKLEKNKYNEIQNKKENLISVSKNTAVVFSVVSGAKPTIKLTLSSYMSTLSSLDVPQFPLV